MSKKKKSYGNLDAVKALLESLGVPYVVILQLGETFVGRRSKTLSLNSFLNMIAGFLIATAERSDITPIKMLDMIGEVMGKMMEKKD